MEGDNIPLHFFMCKDNKMILRISVLDGRLPRESLHDVGTYPLFHWYVPGSLHLTLFVLEFISTLIIFI